MFGLVLGNLEVRVGIVEVSKRVGGVSVFVKFIEK